MGITATKNILSGLLRIKDGLALSSTLQTISDDLGTDSLLKLSTLQGAIGTAFTNGYFANAKFVSNQYASVSDEGHNIGIFGAAQATLNSATIFGYGLYGHGYTNGSARSGGVVGEGKVTATGDTGSAIGIRGYATDTHAGGLNIGLYGNASGGSANYALYMEAGQIYSSISQVWTISALRLSGTAPLSATAAYFNLGSDIASGSANGTYFGVNSTAGFTGDFINLQVNGVYKFKVSYLGAITSTSTIVGAAIAFGTSNLYSNITGAQLQSSAADKWEFKASGGTNYAQIRALRLQIESGLLATPVNGVLEQDGTNLYFTVGGVRKTVTLI